MEDLRTPGPRDPTSGDAWPLHAYRAMSYESRTLPSQERLVQYWRLRAVHGVREATLWGFTGGLVAALLHRAYGWEPPSAPRIVEAWDEFLP